MRRALQRIPAVMVAALVSHASASAADPIVRPWVYDGKGRCDPFVPLVRDGRPVPCDPSAPSAAESKLASVRPVLGGILWDPDGRSIALINGGEAKVGDVVGGYAIRAIHRDEVVLMREEERLVLRINFDESNATKQDRGRKEGTHR
jgi:hypothetical protein